MFLCLRYVWILWCSWPGLTSSPMHCFCLRMSPWQITMTGDKHSTGVITRVLAKTIRPKTKKNYRAQCIAFGLYIKVPKGICALISASVCTRVITFFFCTGAVQGPQPVQGDLAASQAGRYAGIMVCQCPGIRWMAHVEGKRMNIGWVVVE